ncbi:MAG: SDR family oxidoreductase [Acidobacteriota bacterium]
MRVFITGACGYKGTVLVPKLLRAGHEVIGLDTMWFGNYLEPHAQLRLTRGDVRDAGRLDLKGVEAVIHLASISNDPCGDMDPKLAWEVNALATMRLCDRAARDGVRHLIYASSGSVYGVKKEDRVTEDLQMEPISDYNRTKMVAERVCLSYAKDMVVQIIRPATVCGYSPRMRLDVSVNLLTAQAVTRGRITVLGGSQVRPNVHLDDITDIYLFLLHHPESTGIYNAGFENLSILEIARRVQERCHADIEIKQSNDPRSYRMSSDRLLQTGFRPKKTVEDAIEELVETYHSGLWKDEDRCYNIRWMQQMHREVLA